MTNKIDTFLEKHKSLFKKEYESISGLLYPKNCYAGRNFYWKCKVYKDLTSLVSTTDSESSKETEDNKEKKNLGGCKTYLQNSNKFVLFILNSY